MTEKQGLRFDIYERVHLAGEVRGLEQLDQLELLPYIQVITQEDQAVLKGHLLLTGQFTGTEQYREGKLEHTIPVEITLPMNRIPNLEEIGVDIENFDIDLVAPKTLNVTGVLSLSGIELTQSAPEWKDREQQEEEVFVHQASFDARSEAKEAAEAAKEALLEAAPQTPAVSEPISVPQETQEKMAIPAPAPEPQILAVEQAPTEGNEPLVQAVNEPAPVAAELPAAVGNEPLEANAEPNEALANEAHANEALANEALASDENANAPLLSAEAEPNAKVAEKKEMKIAFTGRKPDEQEQNVQNQQLKSLIKDTRSGSKSKADSSVEGEASAKEKAAKPEGMEWKNLFLARESEEQRFQSVRMCIVQREETMDSIAERYSLNPREIMLYNRMNEQSVREGQILYIPRR